MKSNRDYSDRDAPTDSHSDSKRNVKSKGREYKTPHYTDADIEQRIPELENGCYFEYKSGESLSSESGAASPLGSNGRNGRGGGGRGDIITSRSAAAMTNNHGSNHAPTHHQTAYATTAINSTIAITTEDNTNMIAANTVKNIRRRYNTTSTVHAANTITSPHCEQILFCMSSVLQAQICEDVAIAREDAKYPERTSSSMHKDAHYFDFVPELAAELGGPVNTVDGVILDQETAEDELLREEIVNGFVPTIDTIYRYISLIFRGAGYSPECNIIALVFINRITTTHRMPLTMVNWRSLWLVSVILAQKVWDDRALRTSAFTSILPCFPRKTLRDMENKALELLEYLTIVKPSLYAKYYFELRQLFTEIMGFQDSEWNVKPLSAVAAKKLEHKIQYSRDAFANANRNGGGGSNSYGNYGSSSNRKKRNGGGRESSSSSGSSSRTTASTVTTTTTGSDVAAAIDSRDRDRDRDRDREKNLHTVASTETEMEVEVEVAFEQASDKEEDEEDEEDVDDRFNHPHQHHQEAKESLSWSDEDEVEADAEEDDDKTRESEDRSRDRDLATYSTTILSPSAVPFTKAPRSGLIARGSSPTLSNSYGGGAGGNVQLKRMTAAEFKADLDLALAMNANANATNASASGSNNGPRSRAVLFTDSTLTADSSITAAALLSADSIDNCSDRKTVGRKFGTAGDDKKKGENGHGRYVIS